MSLLKRNIIANFTGNIWTALISLVFVPLYIHFMGIEAFGLIGIFTTLQAVFSLMDMGLSTTLNREMARLSLQENSAQEMRNLVRTLETIYWAVALFMGVTVIAAAPLVAYHWVQAGQLPPETIKQAITIMGIAMAFQWPQGLYSGGLMGLQKQVLLNVITVVTATIRGVGATIILWIISPTIQAFFIWQIIIGALQTFLVALFLWNSLSKDAEKASFQKKILQGIWRFAAGMSGITVTAIILTQLDKVILSRLLSLEMFGYYSLASALAMSLYRLIGPVFSGVYPRFTQLVTIGDHEGLKQLYHRSCQLMSVLILPTAIVTALFSREILFLWTQNPITARHAHIILSILIIGTALNGLMNLPYALQLAYGWTRLAFYANVVSVILLAPLIVLLTTHYGAVGGASVWVILNAGLVLLLIQLMHRRLLPSEKWNWYWWDVGIPLAAACITACLMHKFLSYENEGTMYQLGIIFFTLIASTAAAAAVTPVGRYESVHFLTTLRSYRN